MDIFKLLNSNTEDISEPERKYIEAFSEKLKDKIIEELAELEGKRIEKLLKENREEYLDVIYGIYADGVRGYNTMTLEVLIHIYLEKAGEEGFINLINSVNL